MHAISNGSINSGNFVFVIVVHLLFIHVFGLNTCFWKNIWFLPFDGFLPFFYLLIVLPFVILPFDILPFDHSTLWMFYLLSFYLMNFLPFVILPSVILPFVILPFVGVPYMHYTCKYTWCILCILCITQVHCIQYTL